MFNFSGYRKYNVEVRFSKRIYVYEEEEAQDDSLMEAAISTGEAKTYSDKLKVFLLGHHDRTPKNEYQQLTTDFYGLLCVII